MHKDVKSNGNWIGFPTKQGDVIQLIRNDDIMAEFVIPYDESEISTYIKRLSKVLEIK